MFLLRNLRVFFRAPTPSNLSRSGPNATMSTFPDALSIIFEALAYICSLPLSSWSLSLSRSGGGTCIMSHLLSN